MSSKSTILNRIIINKPGLTPLPMVDITQVSSYNDMTLQFATTLENIGGMAIITNDWQHLRNVMAEKTGLGKVIINTIDSLGKIDPTLATMEKQQMEGVDTAIIKGELAVAENGAVWVYESQMINRLLPFICQHLIVVVDKINIVATMHQAYQKIDIYREGFGVFIAGPSKTADIEQSLVIGAHGPRSLNVYVI